MGQSDAATQSGAAAGTLPFAFSSGQAPEALPSGFKSAFVSETLKWGELTHLDRTFIFNRELVIRVLKEDGGWAFESDDPELMGFGHTRQEAELTFCLDFAAQWDDLACEEDDKLTQGARKVKRDLLALEVLTKFLSHPSKSSSLYSVSIEEPSARTAGVWGATGAARASERRR